MKASRGLLNIRLTGNIDRYNLPEITETIDYSTEIVKKVEERLKPIEWDKIEKP